MIPIALVGEAWGKEEAVARSPFVGATGHVLNHILEDAGISRWECFITNVFNLHPPRDDVTWFCGAKSLGIPGYPPLQKGKYVRAEFVGEINRLALELEGADPNVVVCLGNTALWALTGLTGIARLRGATIRSSLTISGFKLLPTYHPAAVSR